MDTTYMTQAEIDSMTPIFCTCPKCGQEGCEPDSIAEYKGMEMCDTCYIHEKQFEIGSLELVVSRGEYGGWECIYDGAPDSGCVIGRGNSIQEAIDDYMMLAIQMKHDIDPKHIEYTWTGHDPNAGLSESFLEKYGRILPC